MLMSVFAQNARCENTIDSWKFDRPLFGCALNPFNPFGFEDPSRLSRNTSVAP